MREKSTNCLSLSTNEEHAELEVEDHLEYRVNRILGGKADAVKEQLDVVRMASALACAITWLRNIVFFLSYEFI